jgi:hypothetical protein
VEAEDQDELQIFKNIQRSGLHRVASHVAVFPCVDAIVWILKHVDLENRYILNARGDPIASFQVVDLEKYYHLEKGTQKLDEELLSGFKHKEKDLFKIWYKPKKFQAQVIW